MLPPINIKVLCLEADNSKIKQFIAEQGLESQTVWIDKNSLSISEATLDIEETIGKNTSKVFIFEERISTLSMSLALRHLQLAIDAYVVCGCFVIEDWIRVTRIFHAGGICMDFDDFTAEIKSYRQNSLEEF